MNAPDPTFALYQVARQLVEWDDRYGIDNRRGGLLDRLRDCVTALDETYGKRAEAIRQESAEKLLEGGAR